MVETPVDSLGKERRAVCGVCRLSRTREQPACAIHVQKTAGVEWDVL